MSSENIPISQQRIEPQPGDDVQARAEETDGVEGIADHLCYDPGDEQEGQPPAHSRLWHGVQDGPRDEHSRRDLEPSLQT